MHVKKYLLLLVMANPDTLYIPFFLLSTLISLLLLNQNISTAKDDDLIRETCTQYIEFLDTCISTLEADPYSRIAITLLTSPTNPLCLPIELKSNVNVTVALDGSGHFKTIGAALDSVPSNTQFPYIILVKEDISASQFVAKDMTIINSAGPEGRQAVALRAYEFKITFYRCSIEAVSLQNSFICLRRLLQGQAYCTGERIQGQQHRNRHSQLHPHFSTGIHSIQSNKFNGTFALSTLYYAEYGNFGPGAHTEGRVNWPGYLLLTDCKDVENSTVKNFICGLLVTSIAALHRLVKLVAALLRGYASKVDTHMSGNSVYWVHVSLIKSSSFAVEIFWFKSKREIKVERRKKGMYCKK
ncbi:Uncharacterized protein TCM_026695 [Theobroma cacao]|uniref:Pectinesterase catalytic domain-containing protein n=1 Tax=Theobroma cacao TaxID=3641 RepID=A0A061F4E4_THECC|nr:Uncharacterized protein TCM_026695 [Theobroma cacao]